MLQALRFTFSELAFLIGSKKKKAWKINALNVRIHNMAYSAYFLIFES